VSVREGFICPTCGAGPAGVVVSYDVVRIVPPDNEASEAIARTRVSLSLTHELGCTEPPFTPASAFNLKTGVVELLEEGNERWCANKFHEVA
jgi:hypothetical protein